MVVGSRQSTRMTCSGSHRFNGCSRSHSPPSMTRNLPVENTKSQTLPTPVQIVCDATLTAVTVTVETVQVETVTDEAVVLPSTAAATVTAAPSIAAAAVIAEPSTTRNLPLESKKGQTLPTPNKIDFDMTPAVETVTDEAVVPEDTPLNETPTADCGDISKPTEDQDDIFCCGMKHHLIRIVLSSQKEEYDSIVGQATRVWHYNGLKNTWHSRTCSNESVLDANNKKVCCCSCLRENSSIRKEKHPWLFRPEQEPFEAILPTDVEIISGLRREFKFLGDHRKDEFLNSPSLDKAWILLSPRYNCILIGENQFVSRCLSPNCCKNYFAATQDNNICNACWKMLHV
jgi:hypothetical protein